MVGLGKGNSDIAALPGYSHFLKTIRKQGGWIISTQFTLVPGKGGEPIAAHPKKIAAIFEER